MYCLTFYTCTIFTFLLEANGVQRLYKNITIPDDDLVNPWRSVYLKVKSHDYRVVVPENYSQSVVWVQDDECMLEMNCRSGFAMLDSFRLQIISRWFMLT